MNLVLDDSVAKDYGVHLAKIAEKMTVAPPVKMPDGVKYVFVCFTNRCGSNYLADVLASSKQVNLAEEILNWDYVLRVSSERNISDFAEYFTDCVVGRQKNNRFCVKIAVAHLVLLKASGILDLIAGDCTFVLIERSDKLGQAISLAIANQTRKWASFNPSNGQAPVYNADAIRNNIKAIVRQMHSFDMFFAMNGIVPVSINYEQFVEKPEMYARFLGERMGLPDFAPNLSLVRTEKQADSTNAEWRTRFLEEGGGEVARTA